MKQQDIETKARELDHLTLDLLWGDLRAVRAELRALRAERGRLRKTLQSIADNSCCAPCREAGLFACAALRADPGGQ